MGRREVKRGILIKNEGVVSFGAFASNEATPFYSRLPYGTIPVFQPRGAFFKAGKPEARAAGKRTTLRSALIRAPFYGVYSFS